MEKLEDIKKIFEEYGFIEKEKDHFVYEKISYNTMNINGRISKKEVKNTVEVVYTGTGGTMDDSDSCIDDMLFFDIFSNGEFQLTIGAYTFKEIAETLNIRWEEDSEE